MTQKEFEERTGLSVSPQCYHGLIEPEYMNSDLDKDEWCKQWKRKKGLQVAYYYEQGRAEEAINQVKQYKELSDKRSEIIFEQDKQICHLNEVIKERGKELNSLYENHNLMKKENAELKAKLLKYETAMSALKEIINI